MKVLSVVCARAGSKGLKNKCMRKIMQKWIVQYAIEYSLALSTDVKTVVSTDMPELIEYCRQHTIACIVRNPKFCIDDCKIDDALAEAAAHWGNGCDWISIVYGNIPTRYPEIFAEAVDFLTHSRDYDGAISMQNVEKFHPDWMFDYREDLLPVEEMKHYRRQALPQKMIHDGHTLIFRLEPFLQRYEGKLSYPESIRYSIFGKRLKPILNTKAIVDIDTERDLILAEALIQHNAMEKIR